MAVEVRDADRVCESAQNVMPGLSRYPLSMRVSWLVYCAFVEVAIFRLKACWNDGRYMG